MSDNPGMTPDPALTREAAHAARRDGRAVLATEEWLFRDHRQMSDVMRAELAAAADRAGRKAEAAAERAMRP